MKHSVYEETCVVHCTDNGNELIVDILNFNPEKYLDVSVNKQIKLNMRYDPKHHIYVGSMTGLEFTTKGPLERTVKDY